MSSIDTKIYSGSYFGNYLLSFKKEVRSGGCNAFFLQGFGLSRERFIVQRTPVYDTLYPIS